MPMRQHHSTTAGSTMAILRRVKTWLCGCGWCCFLLLAIDLPLRAATNTADPATGSNSPPGPARNATKASGTHELPFLLGVTVDAARHEFPVDWLLSFLESVHRMGFNALHLSLSGDQRFAFRLEGATGGAGPRLSPGDLGLLAERARSLGGMAIVPGVSLPFFAASWAGVLPGTSLLPDCPEYLCSRERARPMIGTDLPLDLSHPGLPAAIRRVLGTVLSALGDPAYLHLGPRGSEDRIKDHGCWREAEALRAGGNGDPGAAILRDYQRFETALEEILAGGPGHRPVVIRGGGAEDADQPPPAAGGEPFPTLEEYRDHRLPLGQGQNASSAPLRPYLLQPRELSMATSLAKDHPSGWEVYRKTLDVLDAHRSNLRPDEAGAGWSPSPFRGLTISTEAMPPAWFAPRNVLGRLLAVSMAVGDFAEPGKSTLENRAGFERAYLARCRALFPGDDGDDISAPVPFCDRLGGLAGDEHTDSAPPHPAGRAEGFEADRIKHLGGKNHPVGDSDAKKPPQNQERIGTEREYKSYYMELWKDWANEICHRLTETKEALELVPPAISFVHSIQDQAFAAYWRDDGPQEEGTSEIQPGDALPGSVIEPPHVDRNERRPRDLAPPRSPNLMHEVFGNMQVPFRGLIVDLVDHVVPPRVLQDWMEQIMVPLGLNALQLSLMNRLGCALRLGSLEELYHLVPKPTTEPLTDGVLEQIVAAADRLGIELIPEISVTTQAVGWYHAGVLVDCPNTLCTSPGGDIATDVNRGHLLPLVLHVIRRLRGIFRSGSFLHLGSDERRSSQACWIESGRVPNYDAFEQRLSDLLEKRDWYNASSILRWENKEGVVYPKRTGSITHYQYQRKDDPATNKDDYSAAFDFGSIIITPEKDPWLVYEETRHWVKRRPRGLLAKISLKDYEDLERLNQNHASGLLAFALGCSSSAPVVADAPALEKYIGDLCKSKDSHRLCRFASGKEAADAQVLQSTRSTTTRGSLLCTAMTRSVSRHAMRLSKSTTGLAENSSVTEEK